MSEKIQAEITAQRQRLNQALLAKHQALSQVEMNDKVILEASAVIMALEFAAQQAAQPDRPQTGAATAPPETGVTVETEPA